MITVAIISPYRFLETINKVITDHDFDCSFRSYTYDSLSDIDEIYSSCLEECDIILFSGELGYHYMHRHYPNCPIPCACLSTCRKISCPSSLRRRSMITPTSPSGETNCGRRERSTMFSAEASTT